MTNNIFRVMNSNDLKEILQDHAQKLVVIMYSSQACGPCINFKPKFTKYSQLNQDCFFVYIDISNFKDPTHTFLSSVQATPKFSFYFNAQVIGDVIGADEKVFIETLEYLKGRIDERTKEIERQELLHKQQKMDEENHLRIELLKKLYELMQRGVKLTKVYNMSSSVDELMWEYNLQMKNIQAASSANNKNLQTNQQQQMNQQPTQQPTQQLTQQPTQQPNLQLTQQSTQQLTQQIPNQPINPQQNNQALTQQTNQQQMTQQQMNQQIAQQQMAHQQIAQQMAQNMVQQTSQQTSQQIAQQQLLQQMEEAKLQSQAQIQTQSGMQFDQAELARKKEKLDKIKELKKIFQVKQMEEFLKLEKLKQLKAMKQQSEHETSASSTASSEEEEEN